MSQQVKFFRTMNTHRAAHTEVIVYRLLVQTVSHRRQASSNT